MAQERPFAFSNLIAPRLDAGDTLVLLLSTTGPPPPLDALQNGDNWRLIVAAGAASREVRVDDVKWEGETEMLSLTVSRQNTQGVDLINASWRVIYLGGLNLFASVKAPTAGLFKAAKGKEDAALYLFGSALYGPSTKPIYVIDFKVDVGNEFGASGWLWSVGAILNTNTKTEPPVNKVSIDPDAIKLSTSLTKTIRTGENGLYGVTMVLSPAQGEFSRKDRLGNYIAAGLFDFVLEPQGSFTLVPRIGAEIGRALFKPDKIAEQTFDRDAWNGIVRLMAGGTAQWTLFKANATDDDWYHVTVTGSYTARVPFRPEPYVEAGLVDGNRRPIVSVGKNTRHFIDASLDWNVLKYTAVSLKYKYGSQPPLFKLVDHQWIFGFTIKAAKN